MVDRNEVKNVNGRISGKEHWILRMMCIGFD